jgi:serpin B
MTKEERMAGMRKMTLGGALAVAALFGMVLSPKAASAQDDMHAVTAAYNTSGQQLFKQFLAASPGNVVFSPYSIGTAMAMALYGARGDNAAEMAKVLAQTLPPDKINAANAAALAAFNGYGDASSGNAAAQIRVANGLMLTSKDGPISQAYQDELKAKYSAEIFRGADLDQVNNWVKQKTDGKIDAILDSLGPNTVAVLLDAIYFKAPWHSTFDAKSTRDQTFYLASGEAEVPTMRLHGEFTFTTRQGYRAIRLPYGNEHLAMIVVLPDKEVQAADVAARLDAAEMGQVLQDLTGEPHKVDLSLPRFKANFKINLVETFQQLGMHLAFSDQGADFSGMTDRPPSVVPLAIDEIMHRAVIEVTEEGTEAAAATSVVVGVRSVQVSDAERFQVDRPFLFYVVDDATQAILFQGRIADPRESS